MYSVVRFLVVTFVPLMSGELTPVPSVDESSLRALRQGIDLIAVLPKDAMESVRDYASMVYRCVTYYFYYDPESFAGAWVMERNGRSIHALDDVGSGWDMQGQTMTFLNLDQYRDATQDIALGQTIARRHNGSFLMARSLMQCHDYMYSVMYAVAIGSFVTLPEMFQLCFVVPKSASKTIFSILSDPFDVYCWGAFLWTICMISVLLSFLGESYRRYNVGLVFLELVMHALNGPSHRYGGRFEVRIIGLFMLMNIVLLSCYQSLIISLMSSDRYEPELDTMEQINDTCQFQSDVFMQSLGYRFKNTFYTFELLGTHEQMWSNKICYMVLCSDITTGHTRIETQGNTYEKDGHSLNEYFRYSKVLSEHMDKSAVFIAVVPSDLLQSMRKYAARRYKCMMYYFHYDPVTFTGSWIIEQESKMTYSLEQFGDGWDLRGQTFAYLNADSERETPLDVDLGWTIARRHNGSFKEAEGVMECYDYMYSQRFGISMGTFTILPEMIQMCFVVPRSTLKSIFSILLDPFDPYSWGAFGLTVVVVSFLLALFGESYQRYNVALICLELVMNALNGPTHTFKSRFEVQMIGLFMLMNVVLISCYQSLIISLMSSVRYDEELDTIEQVNETCYFQRDVFLEILGHRFKNIFHTFELYGTFEHMWTNKSLVISFISSPRFDPQLDTFDAINDTCLFMYDVHLSSLGYHFKNTHDTYEIFDSTETLWEVKWCTMVICSEAEYVMANIGAVDRPGKIDPDSIQLYREEEWIAIKKQLKYFRYSKARVQSMMALYRVTNQSPVRKQLAYYTQAFIEAQLEHYPLLRKRIPKPREILEDTLASVTLREMSIKDLLIAWLLYCVGIMVANRHYDTAVKRIFIFPESELGSFLSKAPSIPTCMSYMFAYNPRTLNGSWTIYQSAGITWTLEEFHQFDRNMRGYEIRYVTTHILRDITYDLEIGNTIAHRHNATFKRDMELIPKKCVDYDHNPMYLGVSQYIPLPEKSELCFVVPKSAPKSVFLVLIDPYDRVSWIAFGVTIVAISLVLYWFGESSRHNNIILVILEMLMIVLNGPSHELIDRFERFVVGWFMLLSIVVISGYQSLVISFLSSPRYNPQIDTFDAINDTCLFKHDVHLTNLGYRFKHTLIPNKYDPNDYRAVETLWKVKFCAMVTCTEAEYVMTHLGAVDRPRRNNLGSTTAHSEREWKEIKHKFQYYRYSKARVQSMMGLYSVSFESPVRQHLAYYTQAFIEGRAGAFVYQENQTHHNRQIHQDKKMYEKDFFWTILTEQAKICEKADIID
uniref:Ionotropic glutamate receptor C-terminal domain-containing protein n=1 Tax=Anopheles culicifacies TaxID=139723 RepID=A0A182M6M1_9DIPT